MPRKREEFGLGTKEIRESTEQTIPEQVVREFEPEIEKIAGLETADFEIVARGLLRTTMISLRHKYGAIGGQETVCHYLPSPDNPTRENPLVVFGTGHCGYAEMGGCSMCSFGESPRKEVSDEEIDRVLTMVEEHNDQYSDGHAVFNINVIGSFLSDLEIPSEKREAIYKRVRAYADRNPKRRTVFVTEARFEDVDEEKLKAMRKVLGDKIPVELGFGVESTDELVREAIVGKGLDPTWKRKLGLIGKYRMDSALHTMFGLPFLTDREQVAEISRTIKDCYASASKYDKVLLMVMNRKPGTLTDAMMATGKYELPTVSAVSETVLRLGQELSPDELRRLMVLGLVSPKAHIEAGTENIKARDESETEMLDILLSWRGTQEELTALREAFSRVPLEIYDSSALEENLPEINQERLKREIIEEYVRLLATLYCPDDQNLESARDKMRGILDIATQIGGSIQS